MPTLGVLGAVAVMLPVSNIETIHVDHRDPVVQVAGKEPRFV
jgi:hypothetical protein